MKKKQTILICPLDWGLGHASRCVPIINQFLKEGHQVIIGADKNPLAFLKKEFPTLKTIIIPGYEVTYKEKGNGLKLFYESIKFFHFIKKEHAIINQLIKTHNVDLIVSDNRYGLWSKQVKSIIITHQLYIKVPLGEKIAHQKIKKLIDNFDECWIPDVDGDPNLSGDLSHLKPFKPPHKFIGALSRFSSLRALRDEMRNNLIRDFNYDIIAILSGPEPQRTIFENLTFNEIKRNNLKAVVVRGFPNKEIEVRSQKSEVLIFNYLPTKTLYQYIQKSKVVVCRAGYSSIMDLFVLRKKAILVPTPGQTEQEYLAEYHLEQDHFYSQNQNEFDLGKGLEKVNKKL